MELPPLGLGTFRLDDEARCRASVETALDVGYRLVDTAARYGNEAAVGAGLAASAVPREEVVVATKVLHPRLTDAAEAGRVEAAVRDCRDRLGVDVIDLLYVHWPDDYDLDEAFSAFAALADDGVIRHVGVSNFTVELLEAAAERDPPVVANQVEMHPLLPQEALRTYCARHDVALVAYAPLIRGQVAEVPELRAVAARHDATPAQVSLAWLREHGAVPIPKASSQAHLRENWASLDLDLDPDDVATIDAIDRERRSVDPPFAPDW